jgi:hypothetical protein
VSGRPGDHDRRDADNAQLRRAFDDLSICIVQATAQDDAALLEGVQLCARRARERGLPPEKFVIVLKRFLARYPELATRAERAAGDALTHSLRGAWSSVLVTWAIKSYFAVAPERGRDG